MSIAQKVKALWCASYMFSFLMECIVENIKKQVTIISPATISRKEGEEQIVGLYPDRIYFESELNDIVINKQIQEALNNYNTTTKIDTKFLNIMVVSIPKKDNDEHIGNVLKELNNKLDTLELYNRGIDEVVRNDVYTRIHDTSQNELFKTALGTPYMSIGSDEDIANVNATNDKGTSYSLNKYLCIVQADGDNMGKLVCSLKDSEDLGELSSKLLSFGQKAANIIKDYGGIPIYAGGDDLLFVAPVRSSGWAQSNIFNSQSNIFNLIQEIDECYQEVQETGLRFSGNGIRTTMSYGVSISYHKYPRYEALEDARELLFDTAKNVPGKNAIAWCLKKHSGTGYECAISKSDEEIYKKFQKLFNTEVGENQVSAIAHKLRQFDGLIDAIHKHDEEHLRNRLDAMYGKLMDEESKKSTVYTELTRELLALMLLKQRKSESKEGKEETIQNTVATLTKLYGMLRTTKFIRGEEDKND
jgi:CRISPR-associated protein Cmr2